MPLTAPWLNGTTNPAAYGTVPAPTTPQITAGEATSTAIGTGQQVNSQLPGYQASLANVGQNIQSETSGQLPQDVLNQLAQQAAERGVATGSPGSENSNASYLKDLGLNSLQLTQTGQGNLQSILPQLPGAAISQNPNFYPSSGLDYEAQSNNAALAAAPNPLAAAQANLAAARSGVAAGQGAPTLPGSPNSNGSTDAFMNGEWSPSNGPVLPSNSNFIYQNGQLVPAGALTPGMAEANPNGSYNFDLAEGGAAGGQVGSSLGALAGGGEDDLLASLLESYSGGGAFTGGGDTGGGGGGEESGG